MITDVTSDGQESRRHDFDATLRARRRVVITGRDSLRVKSRHFHRDATPSGAKSHRHDQMRLSSVGVASTSPHVTSATASRVPSLGRDFSGRKTRGDHRHATSSNPFQPLPRKAASHMIAT